MKTHTRFHHALKPLVKTVVIINAVFGTAYLLYYTFISPFVVHDTIISAARTGDFDTVQRLAPYDLTLSRTGFEEHMTPLGAAVQKNHVPMVAFLLSKNVDVHSRDDHGKTALRLSRYWDNKEISRLLLKAGARY